MGETDDEIILTEALENDIDESDVYSEACYSVTCEELVDLMKRQDILVAINERFTNVCGLVKALKSSATQGLLGVHSDLEGRVKLFGENFIETRPPKTFLKLVWEALRDPILRILSVCAIISFILGMIIDNIKTGWIEGFAILVAVAICSLVAALNDWQKEKQFRQLQNKIDDEQVIDVIRNGEVIKMQTTKLVVGDICLLNYGNLIPADGILLQGNDLKVDESSLTGESGLVKKNLNNPALFSGTHVMEGSGKYIITAVGVNSKSGMIMVLLGAVGKTTEAYVNHEEVKIVKKENQSQEKEKSILQSKLTKLAVMIGWIGVAAGVITSFVIILRFCIQTYAVEKKSWDKKHLIDFLHAIIVGITIMVVAIPEGLPLAVTISLTYSIKKMLLDNNLVRHLTACETMGNATVICSDKTGTLTTNRMTVVESYMQGLYFKGTPNLSTLKKDFVELFCQSISINSNYGSQIKPSETAKGLASQLGNKTECALLGFVLNLGENYQTYRDEVPQEKFVRVYTFNSLRKSMSTVIKKPDGGYRLFSKGASEILLQKCSKIVNNVGSVEEFNESQRENINDTVIKKMASNGLRTILVTYRDFSPEETPNWEDESSVLSNLTCMAIVGIEDPVRAEVPYAIKQCQNAGITIRMVTGDNINTARSIALKCGILDINSEFLVIEGSEFNLRIRDDKGKIQQELIDNIWPQIRVLARSSPEDKYNLVKGIIDSRLTKAREIVAVTGDGTNDGPALKKADVGFAMGIQGTEVAKEASDIILTDDNFTSIVKAVMWGRNVYDGISKFIQFQCTVNFAAIWISIIGSIVLSVSPLSAMQLLWINLIMDSFASLALATEHPSDSLLERKPYGRTKSLISHSMLRFILGHGFYQLIIILILTFYGHTLFDIPYGFANPREPSQHLTILFNTFVMMQIFNEVNARMVHGERNVFKNIFSNKLFSLIVFGTFIVQILLIELGGRALSVLPLSIDQWLWCIFLGFSELLWGQLIISLPKYKNRI